MIVVHHQTETLNIKIYDPMNQRQILFRGLTASNEWVEGVPFFIPQEGAAFIIHNCRTLNFTANDTEFDGVPVNPESVSQFTNLHDKHGKRIFEGMKMKCSWLAELGITEFDCEAIGTVVYQPAIAAYVLEFDEPFKSGFAEDMVYEEEQMQLREYDEDETISFEIIETPELIQP